MAIFSGNATYYDTGPNLDTACGRRYDDNNAVIVAVSTDHWTGSDTNHDPICDKGISVTDPNSVGFSLTVLIEDRCGSCRTGDLDLSRAAFEKFHNVDVGVFAVQWEFVSRTGK